MTPIKEYESNEFIDYAFEDDTERTCEVCGSASVLGNDTLCFSCREEYEKFKYAWNTSSEEIRELVRKEFEE